MSKKFSLNDPEDQSSVKTNLIVDEAENKFHIENYQDQATIKEILDSNKKAQNEGAYKLNALKNEKGYRCLLYTSPSPRDRTRSRMPSSA